MAWTTPLTAVANTTLPAATWNSSVRDNLNATAVALASAEGQYPVATGVNALAMRIAQTSAVATLQSTSSTAYADLTTVGPQVTVNTGSRAACWFTAGVSNSSTNSASIVSVAVSGASNVAASDAWRTVLDGVTAGNTSRYAGFHMFTGLVAGSNVFTMKYKVGSGTGSFDTRELIVIPF